MYCMRVSLIKILSSIIIPRIISRVVEWLIKVGGANVNIQDEYSSARRMARVLKTSHYQSKENNEDTFQYACTVCSNY